MYFWPFEQSRLSTTSCDYLKVTGNSPETKYNEFETYMSGNNKYNKRVN